MSPLYIFAMDTSPIPSTSLSAFNLFLTLSSSICFGKGLKINTPCTVSSLFNTSIFSSTSSVVEVSSNSKILVFTPIFSALFTAPLSYAKSDGFTPTLKIANVGDFPFFFNSSTLFTNFSEMLSATSLPLKIFPMGFLFPYFF